MKLSVIIPVYNTLNYMDRCVTSILSNQMDGGLELILVDDGSTDGCAEWCDRLALRHGERVKVAHQSNAGPATAKDHGLDMATGTYIALVDSDDEVKPDMFVKMVDMAERETADIVCCHFEEVFPDGRRSAFSYTHQQYVFHGNEGLRRLLMREGIFTQCWTKIFRRSMIEQYHIRHLSGMHTDEDFVFNIQCFIHSSTVCLIDEPLYIYTNRSESLSKDYFHRHIQAYIDNRWKRFELTEQLVSTYHPELLPSALFNQLYYCNELLGRIAHFPAIFGQEEVRRVTSCMKSHFPTLWRYRQRIGLSALGCLILLLLPSAPYLAYRHRRL